VLLSAGGEPGEYTIIVRSQGELHSSQWYSLIICGQTCPDTPEPLMIATAPASEETFDGKLNITVNGSGFAPGTTAVLQPAIGQPIAPVMSEPGDMLLTTAFSSQKIADGIYDLVVMRPDGLQTVWPGALMVGDNASVDDWRQLEF
jgi:hypothetical protein